MMHKPIDSNAPTFVVYIDESGDEGFRFNGGSSKWFAYNRSGQFVGYGIKFWPREAGDEMLKTKSFEWIASTYK